MHTMKGAPVIDWLKKSILSLVMPHYSEEDLYRSFHGWAPAWPGKWGMAGISFSVLILLLVFSPHTCQRIWDPTWKIWIFVHSHRSGTLFFQRRVIGCQLMIYISGALTVHYGIILLRKFRVLVFVLQTVLMHFLGLIITHMVHHQLVLLMITLLEPTPLHRFPLLTLSFGTGIYLAKYHASFGSPSVIKFLRG